MKKLYSIYIEEIHRESIEAICHNASGVEVYMVDDHRRGERAERLLRFETNSKVIMKLVERYLAYKGQIY